MATWHVINNRLTHDELPEPITGNYIQPPYPSFWWYVKDGKLTHDGLPEPIPALISKPYPSFWWYVEDGELVLNAIPEPVLMGAFLNCKSLTTVEIPSSVKKIGEWAFYNTKIKEVTIASDCEYFDSSFPPDCAINFY